MFTDFLNTGMIDIKMEKKELVQYSPLVLAYIGDAVYEVFVRTLLVKEKRVPVHVLHKLSTTFVKAKAQSDTIHRITPFLTSEEQDVVRRGRNAKSGTIPKNADVTEYKYATGFEALIGYTYLLGDIDRLMDILRLSMTDELTMVHAEAMDGEETVPIGKTMPDKETISIMKPVGDGRPVSEDRPVNDEKPVNGERPVSDGIFVSDERPVSDGSEASIECTPAGREPMVNTASTEDKG